MILIDGFKILPQHLLQETMYATTVASSTVH